MAVGVDFFMDPLVAGTNLKGADALGLTEGASSTCERAREEPSVSHAMGKPRDVWPPTLAVLVGKVKPASVAGETPEGADDSGQTEALSARA